MEETGDRSVELVERAEALLERVESLDDPARDTATEAVQAIVELYGEGIARLVKRGAEAAGDALVASWTEDALVAHLFLLHDLHPEDPETRVRRALDEVRPYLRSHGGDVELKGVEGGVAYVRMRGSCDGCPSSSMTLEMAIEDAVRRFAPDVLRIEAEGAEVARPPLVQLAPSSPEKSEPERNGGETSWRSAGALPQLVEGGSLVTEISGEPVLFLLVDGVRYAYRPTCAVCQEFLAEGRLEGDELTCPGCASRYDVRRAGRCLDAPDRHLDPLPLLVDDAGSVKVALPAGAG